MVRTSNPVFAAVAAVMWIFLLVDVTHRAAVQALPTGSPVCPGDQSAPGAPHRPTTGFVELPLADSGLVVTVGEQILQVTAPDTPTLSVTTGILYPVTIERTVNATFRGVLARINGGNANIDTTTVVSLSDDETDLKIAEPCLDEGVGGVTHTNAQDKTKVTFWMEFDEPSNNVALDINVVQTQAPESIFYYSQYTLNVVLAPPDNDQCLSARALVPNAATPTSGTTLGSTLSTFCFRNGPDPRWQGVWYLFTGTGRLMTISTCHPGTDYDSRMAVMTSCTSSCFFTSTDSGSPIAPCDNPFGRQLTFEGAPDTLYYLFVYGASSSTVGNVQVSLVDYEPPVNDACLDAIPLRVNAPRQIGSTVNATTSLYCLRSLTGRGVWYVATGTGNVMTFSTCHPDTLFDTRLVVQDSTCAGGCLTTVNAGVQGLASCDNPLGRQVTIDSVADRLYYFFVFGSSLGSVGDFEVSVVDYQPPVNDACVDAIPLAVNGPVTTGSTVNATTSVYCSRSLTGRGIWYVMAGTGGVMTVSTCHAETTFDSRLAVQADSCTGACVADEVSLDIAQCNNPFGRQVTFDSVANRLYYIFVLGSTTATVGNFGLSAVDYPRPVNDACTDALPLTVAGGMVTGTTIGATKNTYCLVSGRGVWYVTTGNGNVFTVSTCHAATNFETRAAVQNGGCSSACLSDQGTGACANGNPFGRTVTFDTIAGRQYYVYVLGTDLSSVGDFGISLADNTTVPAPSTVAPTLTPGRPSNGERSGLVAMQASARRIGGAAESRRNLASFTIDEDARQLRGGIVLRAKVSYGGPDAFYGLVVLYDGVILGMTVILEERISTGQIEFFFQVDGVDQDSESITFTSLDNRAQVLELSTPVTVSRGDLIEVGVRESRFAGDFEDTEDLLPQHNTAGITIMMLH